MKIWFDGEKREMPVGAKVSVLTAAVTPIIMDEWGNRVGAGGALEEGVAYFGLRSGERPPSVYACSAAWGPALPTTFATFLLRRIIASAKAAGGALAPASAADFARRMQDRRDPVVWEYALGDNREVTLREAGASRLVDLLTGLREAVVATREVLAFPGGASTLTFLGGLNVVEVGTTNKVKTQDFIKRLGPGVAAVRASVASFAIRGFVADADAAELAARARQAGSPVVVIKGGEPLLGGNAPAPNDADVTIWSSPPEVSNADVCAVVSDRFSVNAAAAAAAPDLWRRLEGAYER